MKAVSGGDYTTKHFNILPSDILQCVFLNKSGRGDASRMDKIKAGV